MIGLKIGIGLAISAVKKYILSTPSLLWGFEDLTGVTAQANTTMSVDSISALPGTNSIKAVGDGVNATKYISKALGTKTPNQLGTLCMWFDTSLINANVNAISIYLFETSNGANSASVARYGAVNDAYRRSGQWHAAHISEFGSLGAGSNPIGLSARALLSVNGTRDPTVRFDALYSNAAGRPTIVLTFDDSYDNHINVAAPAMAARGFKGTAYVGIGATQIGAATRLTWSQVDSLYNTYGWDIGLNQSLDNSYTSMASVAAAVADVQACQAELGSRGYTRALNHLCYSNGSWTITPTQVTTTGTGAGTTAVTVASGTGIVNGMTVSGYGVIAGTTVVSGGGTTSLVLSQNFTGTTITLAFKDTTGAFYRDNLVDAFDAAGIKTGRTTNGGDTFTRFGMQKSGLTLAGQSTSISTFTLAQMKSFVDLAVLRGTTLVFYIHRVIASPGVATGINIQDTDFYALLDYIKTFTDANQADVLTISELWARDGNSYPPS